MAVECNTILEDLAADIGFTATLKLSGWFGGGWLYVPKTADEGHEISKVIGHPAYKQLVKSVDAGGPAERFFYVPFDLTDMIDQIRKRRAVRDLLLEGRSPTHIGEAVGISTRQVYNIRYRLEDDGILPKVFKGKPKNDNG